MTNVSSVFSIMIDISRCLDCDCVDSECLCEYNPSLSDCVPIFDDSVSADPAYAVTQLVPVTRVIRSLSTEDEPNPTEILARQDRIDLVHTVVQSTLGASVGVYLAIVHVAALLYFIA